jgi:hypothetical protein
MKMKLFEINFILYQFSVTLANDKDDEMMRERENRE